MMCVYLKVAIDIVKNRYHNCQGSKLVTNWSWIFGCAPKYSCVIAPVRRKTQSAVQLTDFRLYLRTRTRKTVFV